MMKRILFVLVSLFFSVYCHAQEQTLSYTSKIGKIEFTISPDEFYIEYEQKDSLLISNLMIGNSYKVGDSAAIIVKEGMTGNFVSRKNQLETSLNNILQRIEPVLLFADSTKQIARGEINIQVKNGYSIEDVINSYDYDFEIRPLVEKNHLYTITSKTLDNRYLFLFS